MSIPVSKWLGPDPSKSQGTAYSRAARIVAHECLSGNAIEGASWKLFADSRPTFTKRLGKRRSRKLGQRIGYREIGFCQASISIENGLSRHAFVLRNRTKDRIQRTDSQRLMCWYGDTVMRWIGYFEDYVTSGLMHANVLPVLAQNVCELLAREIARDLHATERTSSRTR